MTARNFTTNGFFWTGVDGYRGSYLTAIRNGDYGIYAFDSVDGQFDHSYGVGQPRRGLLHRPVLPVQRAHHRRRSRSGTASATPARTRAATCSSSTRSWRDNRVGIVPNSGTASELAPAARRDDRRQPRLRQQQRRDGGDRDRARSRSATASSSRAATTTSSSATSCTTTTSSASASSRCPRECSQPDDPKAANFDAATTPSATT